MARTQRLSDAMQARAASTALALIPVGQWMELPVIGQALFPTAPQWRSFVEQSLRGTRLHVMGERVVSEGRCSVCGRLSLAGTCPYNDRTAPYSRCTGVVPAPAAAGVK